eukprot:scaffold18511_cov63-Phaeocystis_antarctica.AAC.8
MLASTPRTKTCSSPSRVMRTCGPVETRPPRGVQRVQLTLPLTLVYCRLCHTPLSAPRPKTSSIASELSTEAGPEAKIPPSGSQSRHLTPMLCPAICPLCQKPLSDARTIASTRQTPFITAGIDGAEASTPPKHCQSSQTTCLERYEASWRLCHSARSGPRTNTCSRPSQSSSGDGSDVSAPPSDAQSLQHVPFSPANWNLCISVLSPHDLANT